MKIQQNHADEPPPILYTITKTGGEIHPLRCVANLSYNKESDQT